MILQKISKVEKTISVSMFTGQAGVIGMLILSLESWQ